MSSSKLLKERIESIQDTMKITNAMYLISSSKLRKARQNYQNVSPYFNRMRDTISRVVPHLPEEPEHPFFHERNLENPRRAYLVLTADKGMAGAYNQNLLKFLREHADPNDRFYVIGQVGYRALRHRDPRLVEEFRYSATAPTLQRARDITVDAIDDFKSGKLDEIYIVYTKIQNALTSEPVMERLLPLDRRFLQLRSPVGNAASSAGSCRAKAAQTAARASALSPAPASVPCKSAISSPAWAAVQAATGSSP